MNYADLIKKYMVANKLTKSGLARKMGVSHNQIYRWLNGKNKPSRLSIMQFETIGIIPKPKICPMCKGKGTI